MNTSAPFRDEVQSCLVFVATAGSYYSGDGRVLLLQPSGGALPKQGEEPSMADDTIIQTPDGPMTWGEWKKKHPVQIPSRRTKGKDLPVKVNRFTEK